MGHQPADPIGDVPTNVGVGDLAHAARRYLDACDEHDTQRHADRLRDERPSRADGEEERAERRTDELGRQQEARLEAGVPQPEVDRRHEHRQQGRGRGVGEDLSDTDEEHHDEHQGDAHVSGDDEDGKDCDGRRSRSVGSHDEATPVDPVGHRAGGQPEQQPRQALQQRGHRDEDRVVGLARDEERPSGQRQPVADVRAPRRRQQPAEAASESWRRDPVHESRSRAHAGGLRLSRVAAPAGRAR